MALDELFWNGLKITCKIDIKLLNIITMNYNMVGVAVAMVISTMHEKSCIDSHNARKFE